MIIFKVDNVHFRMDLNSIRHPTLKQKQPFVVDYLCQILRQSHFQNAFLNANSIVHWLSTQTFNIEHWDGYLAIPVHYFSSNYSFTHSYLEQLWFRLQSKNVYFHKYFLIPSICILDIMEAISMLICILFSYCMCVFVCLHICCRVKSEGLTIKRRRLNNHSVKFNDYKSTLKSNTDDDKIPEPPKFVPFPMENYFPSPSSHLFPNINPFSTDISTFNHSNVEISPVSKISDSNSKSVFTSDESIAANAYKSKVILCLIKVYLLFIVQNIEIKEWQSQS